MKFGKRQFVQGYWRRKASPPRPQYVCESESGNYWDPERATLRSTPPMVLLFKRGAEKTKAHLETVTGRKYYIYKVV